MAGHERGAIPSASREDREADANERTPYYPASLGRGTEPRRRISNESDPLNLETRFRPNILDGRGIMRANSFFIGMLIGIMKRARNPLRSTGGRAAHIPTMLYRKLANIVMPGGDNMGRCSSSAPCAPFA